MKSEHFRYTREDNNALTKLFINFIKKHNQDYPSDFLTLYLIDVLKRLPDKIDNLTIELPIEKIIELYKETGVIVLRDPAKTDALLVGCGNSPLDPVSDYGTGVDEHEHQKFITVNPNILDNPSVVSFFGKDNKKLTKLFEKTRKRPFDTLAFEASHPIAETISDIRSYDYSFLKPDFAVIELTGHKEEPGKLKDQTVEVLHEFLNGPNTYVKRDTFFNKTLLLPEKKLFSIIDNDNLEKFKNHFTNVNLIDNAKCSDHQPLCDLIFNKKSWNIFNYICDLGADLSQTYYGESVADNLKKIVNEDDITTFKEIFKNAHPVDTVRLDENSLADYIRKQNCPAIHRYLNQLEEKNKFNDRPEKIVFR